MRLHILGLIGLSCLGPLWADEVPLHDFDDIAVWAPNKDGGNPPLITTDTQHARQGRAMRISYVNKPPEWGNLTGPCQVPANASALRFWVYKHAAVPAAAMHIWLFEPDGDAWVQQVQFNGRSLGLAPQGWNEVYMPISGFRFDPRGKNTREMTKTNRMLIGCNFGDLEVTIDSMVWETGQPAANLPLPKTPTLRVEQGQRGSLGLLDFGDNPPEAALVAQPPAGLAQALRAAGFGVTLLAPGDLSDPKVLTRDNFDAVVLPYGPFFPLEAKDCFLAYLKAGGSFLSLGGYAFDSLIVLTDRGWSSVPVQQTAADMDKPQPIPSGMNTRIGRSGDAVTLRDDQIGVFDPQFPLDNATHFRLAEWHGAEAVAQGPHYDFSQPVTGFSACGLIGVNSPVFPPVYRRWIPILEAYDDDGTLRGTGLSLMHNYAGTFRGSSWAFSGITSPTDLFLGDQKGRELLARVVRDITEKVFLHRLGTDFACYEKGETARISVNVSNFGRASADRTLIIAVGGRELLREALSLPPGETRTLEAGVAVDDFDADYCPVRAELHAEGRLADAMDTAFCVRSPAVLASGPNIAWADSYLTVDGHPMFLVGTNQTGMMFFSDHENPAIWDRDFRAMSEHGFHILRILHFSPFAKEISPGVFRAGPLDLVNRPKKLIRQMDAILQLAQKHRVAIHLSLHDWMDVTLTDQELAAQADWNRFWAARYKDVPGIFYDVQNEPSVNVPNRPDVVALWNQFLQSRYRTDEALREAWAKRPPEAPMPNVPLGARTDDWDDARSADLKRFETELLNRWVKANVDGIRAGDPDAVVCVGYLPSMPPADKILGTKHTDFSNMHYYGPPERFAQSFKLIDRGWMGKGFSLGEFGAQEAHDARVRGSFTVPTQESIQRFQTYIHYAAGMGAAFIANWDWKDLDEMVFPWGLMHHTSYVPKPWLHTLEQCGLLLSFCELLGPAEQLVILLPDSHRIGPRFNELHAAIERSIELTLDQRVNFGILNEEDLPALTTRPDAIIWPIPYCPSDDTFNRVLSLVNAGSALYVSGDLAFDPARKPTRANRRTQLGLPDATPIRPFDAPSEAYTKPPITATVGQGKVFYVPYPLELRPQPSDADVYRQFINFAGLRTISLEPPTAPVRVLMIRVSDSAALYTLVRTSDGEDRLRLSLPDVNVAVDLAGKGCAFLLFASDGSLVAAESQGEILLRGQRLAAAQGHFGIASLDGRPLSQSSQILVLPHQCRTVDLTGVAHLKAARCYVGPPTGRSGKVIPFDGRIVVSCGTPGRIAVVAPPGELDQALGRLQERLELRPPPVL